MGPPLTTDTVSFIHLFTEYIDIFMQLHKTCMSLSGGMLGVLGANTGKLRSYTADPILF